MKRLLSLFACGLLAAGFALPVLATSGYIHDLTGTATVRIGNAEPRPLKIGDIIDRGQTIATGDNSTAVVKFEDGQVMALAARTSFTVQDYFYNKQNIGASRAVFNLLQGGLRFISGVIGSTNPRSYRLTAGTATIGIRGTDGTVIYDAIAQIVTLAVATGALTMQTPLGNQTIGAGSLSTASQTTAPTPPQPTAAATAAVTAALTILATKAVPVNTPIVVQASANAAAAQAQATALQQAAAQQPANTALQEQAKLAQDQAKTLLDTAVQAAQTAFAAAVAAGAVPPAPPAPPTVEQLQQIEKLQEEIKKAPPASPS